MVPWVWVVWLTPVVATKMYWTDFDCGKIHRRDVDGGNVEDIVANGVVHPVGIALDVTAGKVYWTDFGSGKIQRSDLDGGNVEDLVTGLNHPFGIALDVVADKMYWTDLGASKIQRSNLDGSNVEDLDTNVQRLGIALDVAVGKMYLTHHYNWLGASKIHRCNLDGSNVEDLVTTKIGNPSGIVLDLAADKMYWADWGYRQIQRNSLNGSNREVLHEGEPIFRIRNMGDNAGVALDVAAGKLYWTDAGTSKIHRSDLDGSNVEDLVTTGILSPQGIALDVAVARRAATKYANEKGGASEFFFP